MYRQDRFMVNINTNNGIERQNESLKYQYLKDRRSNSLAGLITILIEEFLTDKYRRYKESSPNVYLKCLYTKYGS